MASTSIFPAKSKASRKNPRSPVRATTRARAATAAEGVKLLRQLRNAPAVFTLEHMHKLEAAIEEDADGPARRIALLLLTQPGAKFLDDVARAREYAVAVAELSDCLVAYGGRLRQLIDLMDAVQVRVTVALAYRTDMDSVFQQARAKGPEVHAAVTPRLVIDNTRVRP